MWYGLIRRCEWWTSAAQFDLGLLQCRRRKHVTFLRFDRAREKHLLWANVSRSALLLYHDRGDNQRCCENKCRKNIRPFCSFFNDWKAVALVIRAAVKVRAAVTLLNTFTGGILQEGIANIQNHHDE